MTETQYTLRRVRDTYPKQVSSTDVFASYDRAYDKARQWCDLSSTHWATIKKPDGKIVQFQTVSMIEVIEED